MTAPFKDHFSTGSANYAAYRPTYPAQLVDELAALCPGTRLALDCGCGTGQLTVLLAERFERVVGTDASAAQIDKAQARERSRVSRGPGRGQRTGGGQRRPGDGRPGRPLAGPAALLRGSPACGPRGRHPGPGYLWRIACRRTHGTAGPALLPPGRRPLLACRAAPRGEGYRNLPFPFEERRLPDLAIEVAWTLDELLGYVGTWSAVKEAGKALGQDPGAAFVDELREAWGDPQTRYRVSWPLTVRAGVIR